MAAAKLNRERFLVRMLALFRRYGYEGATLTRMTRASGLKRASIYHHFPGGKEAIALAVLDHAGRWLGVHVLQPLGEPGSPAARVQKMARALDEFYDHGRESCLLDVLSLGDADGAMRRKVKEILHAWLAGMAAVSREAGVPARTAQERATQALVQLEGALVFTRATGDRQPFARALRDLPRLLTRR